VSPKCDTVKDERNFVGLDDVAILVEKSRTMFRDRLTDSREYGDCRLVIKISFICLNFHGCICILGYVCVCMHVCLCG